jgi:hypothetical protein
MTGPADVHDAFDLVEEKFNEALDESLDPAGPGCCTTTSRAWALRPARSPWTRDAARASTPSSCPGVSASGSPVSTRSHIYRMIGKLSGRVYLVSAPG